MPVDVHYTIKKVLPSFAEMGRIVGKSSFQLGTERNGNAVALDIPFDTNTQLNMVSLLIRIETVRKNR